MLLGRSLMWWPGHSACRLTTLCRSSTYRRSLICCLGWSLTILTSKLSGYVNQTFDLTFSSNRCLTRFSNLRIFMITLCKRGPSWFLHASRRASIMILNHLNWTVECIRKKIKIKRESNLSLKTLILNKISE